MEKSIWNIVLVYINLLKLFVDTLSLTRENAFTFAENDSWESITSKFLLLAQGTYGTKISWESNNPTVISVQDHNAKVNRQSKDSSVILTAEMINGNQKLEKTFLLVVKSNTVGKKETENNRRNVEVVIGSDKSTPQTIQRINLFDQQTGKVTNKIDKIVVDESILPSVTDQRVSIYLPDDSRNLANELAIEVPYHIVQKMTGDLEVKTDQGRLFLSQESLKELQKNGIDLFFRIVPLRQEEEKQSVMERTLSNEQVMNEVKKENGRTAKILGTPREIETNYKGYETEIMLPLDDVLYEGINIDMLRVFIEHTDGERKVVPGEIVYENGKPIGIKFTVNKFSTFTIFEIVSEDDATEGSTPVETTPDKDTEVGNKPDRVDSNNEKKSVENKKVIESKELPNTATSMYNLILIGVVIIIVGASLIIVDRRRKRLQ